MSEIEDIIRARHAQDEAMAEINTKIQACQESIRNFEHLSRRIETLPDKLSHEVMVPFGKFAFMPGRIVHTNELLVHLGDAYFAGMTCKQSLKILEMRKQNLENTLTDLNKVAENIHKKTRYLSDIKNAAEGKDFEIKEELSGSYSHPKDRRRVSRVKDDDRGKGRQSGKKDLTSPKDVSVDQHAALMARLDELERMEDEEDEICRLSDEGVDNSSSKPANEHQSENSGKGQKHVRFEEKEQDLPGGPVPCTIRFKHSKQELKKSNDMTPADVCKLVHTQPEAFKSILKQSRTGPTDIEHTAQTSHKDAPIADLVIERTPMDTDKPLSLYGTTSSKPVSKFKASRIKR